MGGVLRAISGENWMVGPNRQSKEGEAKTITVANSTHAGKVGEPQRYAIDETSASSDEREFASGEEAVGRTRGPL